MNDELLAQAIRNEHHNYIDEARHILAFSRSTRPTLVRRLINRVQSVRRNPPTTVATPAVSASATPRPTTD